MRSPGLADARPDRLCIEDDAPALPKAAPDPRSIGPKVVSARRFARHVRRPRGIPRMDPQKWDSTFGSFKQRIVRCRKPGPETFPHDALSHEASVAVLVFLARAAGAGLVAADAPPGAGRFGVAAVRRQGHRVVRRIAERRSRRRSPSPAASPARSRRSRDRGAGRTWAAAAGARVPGTPPRCA